MSVETYRQIGVDYSLELMVRRVVDAHLQGLTDDGVLSETILLRDQNVEIWFHVSIFEISRVSGETYHH